MLQIPERIQQALAGMWDHESGSNGANCWNTTQVFFDSSIDVAHTPAKAMDQWLASYTVQIEAEEPGAILVMRGPYCPRYESDLVHTMVYLGDDQAIDKYGCLGEYRLGHIETLRLDYERQATSFEWRRYVKADISSTG